MNFEEAYKLCINEVTSLSNYLFPIPPLQDPICIPSDYISNLMSSCTFMEYSKGTMDRYSEPMVWIGIYIAIASLLCILAMAADLFHGFRNRKFWFPCKYFSLNAASITVITVTMKLPVDLSSPMPGFVDQVAKLGSMAFMCVMMVNLMPSLASMDSKTLLANVIGMDILVITIIVNICIEIKTGVIHKWGGRTVTYIYMVLMFLLVIILIALAITIPTSKQILESKYQAIRKTTPNDQQIGMSTVEKLRQRVRRYWVMAESGSPQFVMTSNPLSHASDIICVIGLLMYIVNVLKNYSIYHWWKNSSRDYMGVSHSQSEYKWSILAILITQFIGVVVGSIAPIFRCFRVLSSNLFTKWNRNRSVVFKVEKYWTEKLWVWKESRLPFLPNGRRSRTIVQNLKNLVLSLCIRFQNVVVVSCKMIGLIIRILLLILVGCCSYCWKPLKAQWFSTPIASSSDDIEEDLDLSNYVLQIEEEKEFAQKILKGISNSMDRFMKKVEKEQHNNLVELLEKSTTTFEGVEKFDTDQVQPLLPIDQIVNSWSLPVVTLTCIVVALPNIPKDKVESLFKAVGDSLSYTRLVEESLNCASEYVNVRRVTMNLWHEVEDNYKWLQNTLERSAYEGKTSIQILEWFADKAEAIVRETNGNSNGELQESFPNKSIAANSMHRIARTILFNYQSNIESNNEEWFFELLSSMIADILSACFTNLPQVIITKCHESVIEKREASVEAATKLLCRSTKIITKLEACELPSMDPDKMAFIDEWCSHLKRSIP